MRPPAKKLGGDIGAVGPNGGFLLGVEADLAEHGYVLKWLEELAPKVASHVHLAPKAISKLCFKDIVVQILDARNCQLIWPGRAC